MKRVHLILLLPLLLLTMAFRQAPLNDAQLLSSGSNAASLISVSPSSLTGTESRTIPLPA